MNPDEFIYPQFDLTEEDYMNKLKEQLFKSQQNKNEKQTGIRNLTTYIRPDYKEVIKRFSNTY